MRARFPMYEIIRIKIDGDVVFPPIMSRIVREKTGCTVSKPSEGGRMSIDATHRSDREIKRIRATLREMVGVTILDEDQAHAPLNGKATLKKTGKK